jgi:hypothetical protein
MNADINERLRALMRYHGELSRYIDEAFIGESCHAASMKR